MMMRLLLHQKAGTEITDLTSEIKDAEIGDIRVSLEEGWPHLRASLSVVYYGVGISPEARRTLRNPGILEIQKDGTTIFLLYWNPANLEYNPRERKYTLQFTGLFDGLAKFVDSDNWWNILDAATMRDTMQKFVSLHANFPVSYHNDGMSPFQLDPAYVDEEAQTYHPLFAGFVEPTSWLVGQEYEKGEGISWQKFRILSVLSVAASRFEDGIYALCVGEINDVVGTLSDGAGYYLPFVVYARWLNDKWKFEILDCFYSKTGWHTTSGYQAAVWFGNEKTRTGQRGDSYLFYAVKDINNTQKDYIVLSFVGVSHIGLAKAGALYEVAPGYSSLFLSLLYCDGTEIHHIDVHRSPIIEKPLYPYPPYGGWGEVFAYPSRIYIRGQGYWTGSPAGTQGVVVWGWTARPSIKDYCSGDDNYTIIRYITWTPTGWQDEVVMFELITRDRERFYGINAGVNYSTASSNKGAYDPILVMLELFQDPENEGNVEQFEVQFAFTVQDSEAQVENEDYSNLYTIHAQGWIFATGATEPLYDVRKRFVPSWPNARAICPIGIIPCHPSQETTNPLVRNIGYAFIYGIVDEGMGLHWAWVEARRASLHNDTAEWWTDEPFLVDPEGSDPDRCTAYIRSIDVDADRDSLATAPANQTSEFRDDMARIVVKDSRAGRYRISCSQMNYRVYAPKDMIYRNVFHMEIGDLSGKYEIFTLALETVYKPLFSPTTQLYSLAGSDYPMNGNVVPMVYEGQACDPASWRFVCLPPIARDYGMVDEYDTPYWGDARQPNIELTEYGAFYREITTAYTAEPHKIKAGFIISTLPHVSEIGDMHDIYGDIGRVGTDTATFAIASEYRYPCNIYNSHRGYIISRVAWWSFDNRRPNYLERGLVECASESWDENLHRLSYTMALKQWMGGQRWHICLVLTPRWPLPGDKATISGGEYWPIAPPPTFYDDILYEELTVEIMGLYWDSLILGPEGGAMLTNWWWEDQPSFDTDLTVAAKALSPQWAGVGFYRGSMYNDEMAWLTDHEHDLAGARVGFRQVKVAIRNLQYPYAVGAVIPHDIMDEIYAACGDPELRQYRDENGDPRDHHWQIIAVDDSHTDGTITVTVQEMPGPEYVRPMNIHIHTPSLPVESVEDEGV